MLLQTGLQQCHILLPAFDDLGAGLGQFFGPGIQTGPVGALQEMVALLECPVIIVPAVQVADISGIHGPVEIAPPGFRSRFDHAGIVRGKHNRVQFAVQVGRPPDPLAVNLHPPAGRFQRQFDAADCSARFYLSQKLGLGTAMPDQFRCPGTPEGTRISQQVYGFQQICLSLAIESVQQVEALARLNPDHPDIAKT